MIVIYLLLLQAVLYLGCQYTSFLVKAVIPVQHCAFPRFCFKNAFVRKRGPYDTKRLTCTSLLDFWDVSPAVQRYPVCTTILQAFYTLYAGRAFRFPRQRALWHRLVCNRLHSRFRFKENVAALFGDRAHAYCLDHAFHCRKALQKKEALQMFGARKPWPSGSTMKCLRIAPGKSSDTLDFNR